MSHRRSSRNASFPSVIASGLPINEQLDHMTIRVSYKNDAPAVRPQPGPDHLESALAKPADIPIKSVHFDAKMVTPIGRLHGRVPASNQMQLLPAQAEPGPGNIEVRSRQLLEAQHLPVKATAGCNVVDVQGHMVDLLDSHCRAPVESGPGPMILKESIGGPIFIPATC